jgi:hypothetical protein
MDIFQERQKPEDVLYKPITLSDWASYWDITVDQIPDSFSAYLAKVNTRHRLANKQDLESFISCFIQNVSKPTANRTAEENIAIFERGWAQHKQDWLEKGNLSALVPKYHYNIPPYLMGPGGGGGMYVVEDSLLASNMQALCTRYLALTYLKPFETIHEFGSGSGMNLYLIAETAPEKKVIGYEWTQSGVAMADSIGKLKDWSVTGRHFDMFHPDQLADCGGDAVLIFGVIEQLHDSYHDFVTYLLEKKPGIVINLELDGAGEMQANVYGELSNFFLKLRGYSQHYTQDIHALKLERKIEIIFDKFLPWLTSFCNLRCTIWKPL